MHIWLEKVDNRLISLEYLTHNTVKYYTFSQWPQLTHGIFTRHGGVSTPPWDSLNVGGTVGDNLDSVSRNHQLMYNTLNIKQSCTVWLVHGNDVVIVDAPVAGRKWVALADAMITDKPDLALVMRYADCTPIMLYDPTKGVIGIAHAGWRGTVLKVASKTVHAMVQAYGCKPSDIQAGIGPAIGPDRYQVGEEVVEAVQTHFGTLNGGAPDGPLIKRDPQDGTAYFNLWSANYLDLASAGVEKIEVARICTATNTHEFFSHRAESGKTGRFGALITI